MLIGYESGQIVFWDLKTKNADYRCQSDVPLRSISWHHEGKQFMCSHTDGSLSTWTVRQLKPTNVTHPHGKKKFSRFISFFFKRILKECFGVKRVISLIIDILYTQRKLRKMASQNLVNRYKRSNGSCQDQGKGILF